MRLFLKYAALPGALLALVGLWLAFGLPTVALSTDIHRLDRGQANMAVQIYQGRIQSLLSIQPPTDPVARQNWEEQLREQRKNLDAAQQRQIELSK